MINKFKKGDKVRIGITTGYLLPRNYKKGTIHTITTVGRKRLPTGDYMVTLDGKMPCRTYRLELVR